MCLRTFPDLNIIFSYIFNILSFDDKDDKVKLFCRIIKNDQNLRILLYYDIRVQQCTIINTQCHSSFRLWVFPRHNLTKQQYFIFVYAINIQNWVSHAPI